jgi:SNF family Na+-dependent transporter
MKLPIITLLVAVVIAVAGTCWSAYRLLARILDDAPSTAGQILMPIGLCYLIAIVIWGLKVATFVRSDR